MAFILFMESTSIIKTFQKGITLPFMPIKKFKLILQILHKKRCDSLNIHEAAPPHKNKRFSRKLLSVTNL